MDSIMRIGGFTERDGAWLQPDDDFLQDPSVSLHFESEFLMDQNCLPAVSLPSPAHAHLYRNSTPKIILA